MLIMSIYWEKTDILSVNEMKERLSWSLVNAQVKTGKIHNTEGWVNKCFEGLNIRNNPNNSKNELIKN